MRKWGMSLGGIGMLAAVCASSAAAQRAPAPLASGPVDPAGVPMPNLAFTPTEDVQRNYFKYHYFHRADTDFETAYADLQECDGYARGLAYRTGGVPGYVPVPATLAGAVGGAIGGAIGNALADAIYGSAHRRQQRRMIMRTCMGYKDYRTFGLTKDLWEAFNFSEGNSSPPEARRQEFLRMQARAASGPRPTLGEMDR